MIVAEFTTLYHVHLATSSEPIKSVSSGSNHGYAIGLLGLIAGGLVLVAVRTGSRSALLAVGVIGAVALAIALLIDLHDAQATGLAGSAATHYVNASSTPSAGMYMETLGSVLLIASCGLGFLMVGGPGGPESRGAARS
jgi:hypothetical protein